MAGSHTLLLVKTDLASATQTDLLSDASSRQRPFGQKVVNFFKGLLGGARSAIVMAGTVANSADPVQASQTGTFTGAPTAADTVTVNGVVFTARASGAVGNEFNIGGTVTITAANLAAAINASASDAASGVVVASSALGVVTITCLLPGVIGNAIALSESCANFTFAGANLASGTGKLPSLTSFSFSR